jgi:alpha-L-fucosidase
LLNVGPRADGSIPDIQSKALLEFSRLAFGPA